MGISESAMNRVRIVSLIAATLGVAVGAGTLFQQETMRQEAAPRAASVQAGVSLVGLAASEPDDGTIAEPETEPDAATTGRPTAPPVTRPVSGRVATASVLPGMITTADPLADHARATDALVVDTELARAADETDEALQPGFATLATDPALIEDLLAEVDACAVWLVVTPESNAMLDMSLFAPCDGGDRVEISHAGLRFDARIGSDGQLALTLPALVPQAEVTVSFEDGRSSSDMIEVVEAGFYDRVAIQWQGADVLGLNAYEFGADYGSDNHIHPANTAAPGDSARGFLTILGAETDLAQVYSFPTGASARAGQVVLELEVAVTDESCGQPLSIDSLEMLAGAEAVRREIRLEMPDCDGHGGFLVLKNLLPELTIALN